MSDSRHHSSSPGFTRGPRIADLMTAEYDRFVESSLAAERAGDAETALEYHCGVPMFARGAHKVQLTQLAALSEEMTPWMWARWAAYQCTRAEGRHRSGQIGRTALDHTMRTFYSDRLQQMSEAREDPMRLAAQVLGQSWIFHQLCTFELGGLTTFLDTLAADRLVEEAAWAGDWSGTRMGGYRLEGTAAGALIVRDLLTEREVPLLDLGSSVHAQGDGWLVGRVVSSGTTPALMFDSRPIAVDEQTAREVATSSTYGGWITALKRATEDGRVDRSVLESEDRELVTDVPGLSLLERATPPAALASTMEQLHRGRDEIGRAAFRILREVADGRFRPDEDAAYVAAAVLNPYGYAEACRCLTGVTAPARWTRWADLVPEPGRARLHRLAGAVSAAA